MESSWPAEWPNIGVHDDLHIFDPDGDILLQLYNETQDSDLAPEEEPTPTEEPAPEETAGGKPLTPTVYLRVSSKHLILASAMFRNMLSSDKFSEGQDLRSKGNLIIRLPDDAEVLITLMYIVHGITRRVPRKITLDTLTKLATLINYYQLHEAVEIFSDMWLADLKQKSFPTSYDSEVIPWLFVSWVFLMRDEFAQLTRILVNESDDRWEDDIGKNLLIPASIINEIQEHRIEAIGCIITIVHNHIDNYFSSNICASGDKDKQFSCDAIVLGSLLKSSSDIGIWPRPEVPYCGMTFKSLASQVEEMRVIHHQCSQDNPFALYNSCKNRGVKEAMKASVNSLERRLCGLNLDFYLLESRSSEKSKKKNKDADVSPSARRTSVDAAAGFTVLPKLHDKGDLLPRTMVFEHASKPLFWILAIAVIAFWFITVASADPSSFSSTPEYNYLPIRFTKWLCPYLTTRRRHVVAASIYVSILGVQLLEGRWVLVTNWRFLQRFLGTFPPMRTTGFMAYAVFSCSLLVVVGFGLFTIAVGVAIVSLQGVCIVELMFFNLGQKETAGKYDRHIETQILTDKKTTSND
ncbi:hypothetical protein V496_07855 [Pseudogymnoascus sp. VKM F-4515 (FW-2607)]|nr:hypothetical protein V496_07855 [Pseudogymnoascus sp. VKM F-4515 (FW-2607)]